MVVTLSCTSPVPYIEIEAALYFNGQLVSDSGTIPFYNTNYAQANAPVGCQDGYYQGWMSYYVEFPSGYSPPDASSSGWGNEVYITC
ncbi:MAG: hypothetical protein M1118_09580 [Chloroflexi bacterium]|nr:hypothetical protein [Chloroflexota bacterium]